jgi:hypothetical protein
VTQITALKNAWAKPTGRQVARLRDSRASILGVDYPRSGVSVGTVIKRRESLQESQRKAAISARSLTRAEGLAAPSTNTMIDEHWFAFRSVLRLLHAFLIPLKLALASK